MGADAGWLDGREANKPLSSMGHKRLGSRAQKGGQNP